MEQLLLLRQQKNQRTACWIGLENIWWICKWCCHNEIWAKGKTIHRVISNKWSDITEYQHQYQKNVFLTVYYEHIHKFLKPKLQMLSKHMQAKIGIIKIWTRNSQIKWKCWSLIFFFLLWEQKKKINPLIQLGWQSGGCQENNTSVLKQKNLAQLMLWKGAFGGQSNTCKWAILVDCFLT